MHDIQEKHFKKIILDMIKAEKLKKKKLIIIKSKKGNTLALYKDFKEKDKSLIFDIKNNKIIYNDINYLNKEIKNDDYLAYLILKFLEKPLFNKILYEKITCLNKISIETFKENAESLEIYGLSLIH